MQFVLLVLNSWRLLTRHMFIIVLVAALAAASIVLTAMRVSSDNFRRIPTRSL
jgi:hypothetical protein